MNYWKILAIVFIMLTLSLVFIVYRQNNSDNFFTDYIIAVNNYHIASSYSDLASTNLDSGNWFSLYNEGYYNYEEVIDYYDTAKEQLSEAKELLLNSKTRLERIKSKVPNSFYKTEIENRIEQNGVGLNIVDKYYSLVDYASKELYEVNYGSEEEATRYNEAYNSLIPSVNDELIRLSEVSNRIDLAWEQNWYELFEGGQKTLLTEI